MLSNLMTKEARVEKLIGSENIDFHLQWVVKTKPVDLNDFQTNYNVRARRID